MRKFWPLANACALIALFVGLWFYAASPRNITDTQHWVLAIIFLAVLALSSAGAFAAAKIPHHPFAKALHIAAMIIVIVAAGSFCVLSEPTTINIFGTLGLLAGLLLAISTGVVLAKSPRTA